MVSFPNSECFPYAPPSTAAAGRSRPPSLSTQAAGRSIPIWTFLFVTFNHDTHSRSAACSAFPTNVPGLAIGYPVLTSSGWTHKSRVLADHNIQKARSVKALELWGPDVTELFQGHLGFHITHMLITQRNQSCFWQHSFQP